jgi:hypothetical protein
MDATEELMRDRDKQGKGELSRHSLINKDTHHSEGSPGARTYLFQ